MVEQSEIRAKSRHEPVLLTEVLEALHPLEGGIYVDGTFGAGGYTSAILQTADCAVYAIDRDAETIAAGAALAAYHAGIEWQWWQGPQACAGGTGPSGTLPDLSGARIIRCDEAPWRFLGLSFAGWNAVISLLLAAIALNGARQR